MSAQKILEEFLLLVVVFFSRLKFLYFQKKKFFFYDYIFFGVFCFQITWRLTTSYQLSERSENTRSLFNASGSVSCLFSEIQLYNNVCPKKLLIFFSQQFTLHFLFSDQLAASYVLLA